MRFSERLPVAKRLLRTHRGSYGSRGAPGSVTLCEWVCPVCRRVTEDTLVPICCGLYELLSGVLLILPDAMLEDVMDKLIQAEVLLVLVNHPSPAIQRGVIQVRGCV